LTTKLIIK